MTRPPPGFAPNKGHVAAQPADFPKAIAKVKRQRLTSLAISYDFNNKPNAPKVDLSLLAEVPQLTSLILLEMARARLVNFDAIYGLQKLKALTIHTYKKLDLKRFPAVERLNVTDGPGLTGLESLEKLRYARIKSLRADDLSFLRHMPDLDDIWIILAKAKQLRGLEKSRSLSTLKLSYCRALEGFSGLPKGLKKLSLERCPHLKDLSFLAGHPSLEFLSADVVEDLAFVPRLPRLDYLNFEDVVDGDLTPVLASKSLSQVGFAVEKKHFSHTEKAINEALAKSR